MDSICPLCNQEVESNKHLFLQCYKMSQARAGFDPKNCCNSRGSVISWFKQLKNNYDDIHVEETIMVLWG